MITPLRQATGELPASSIQQGVQAGLFASIHALCRQGRNLETAVHRFLLFQSCMNARNAAIADAHPEGVSSCRLPIQSE
ncbi:MAG: hypothetical protein ACRCZ5_06485 [Burkholderiales bacterium]|jgi:hypothetical protein